MLKHVTCETQHAAIHVYGHLSVYVTCYLIPSKCV